MKPRHVKIAAIFGTLCLSIGLGISEVASRYASGEHPKISATPFDSADVIAEMLFLTGTTVLAVGVVYPIFFTISFPLLVKFVKSDPATLRKTLFFKLFFIHEWMR